MNNYNTDYQFLKYYYSKVNLIIYSLPILSIISLFIITCYNIMVYSLNLNFRY